MTFGKLFSLALAATVLAGCATTSATDKRDATHSYAWNVWQSMEGSDHATEMPADPNWTALQKELQDPNNSWHLAKNSRPAPERKLIKRVLSNITNDAERSDKRTYAIGDIVNKLGSLTGFSNITTTVGGALMFTGLAGSEKGKEVALHEETLHEETWLEDRALIYIPVAKFEDGLDADKHLIEAFKKAAEATDKNLAVKVYNDCFKVTICVASPSSKTCLLSVEKPPFPSSKGSLKPYCPRTPFADKPIETVPSWLNHGLSGEKAWTVRSLVDMPGTQRKKIATFVSHLPDNFYFYLAPRVDDKTGHLITPVMFDNNGAHSFVKPAKSAPATK